MSKQLSTTPKAENVKIMSLKKASEWYNSFKKITQTLLQNNVDYGVIPGTGSKPTLKKPGAEKLALFYNLQVNMSQSDKNIDTTTGFIYFSYKCQIITAAGLVRGECEGSCNSFEKKYLYWKNGSRRTPEQLIDAMNTYQKMAQKRAYVGAVLLATGASEFFTQDVEDMGYIDVSSNTKKPAPADTAKCFTIVPNTIVPLSSDQLNALTETIETIDEYKAGWAKLVENKLIEAFKVSTLAEIPQVRFTNALAATKKFLLAAQTQPN